MVGVGRNARPPHDPKSRVLLLNYTPIMVVAIGVEPISLDFQSIAMTASAKQPYGDANGIRTRIAAVKGR